VNGIGLAMDVTHELLNCHHWVCGSGAVRLSERYLLVCVVATRPCFRVWCC